MSTITLYKTNSGFTNIPPSWTLDDADPREENGGSAPHTFALPDGYRVGKTQTDQPAIFDARGKHCNIVHHNSGRPSLVTDEGIVVLKA